MNARKTKSTPYRVGYGKLPRHMQFRRGRSGNPHGRPPRNPARRVKDLTLQEVYRGTTLNEKGRMVPATVMQAILRSHIELATRGNVQAQRAILAVVQKIEEDNELDEMLAGRRHERSGEGVREHEPDAAEPDGEGWDRQE
jgi:Family of unknown function (DUF5681)